MDVFVRSCLLGILLIVSLTPAAFAQTSNKGKANARTKGGDVTGPREYTSRNFFLRTDLPADEAKDLLARLETMIVQVGRYWGKPNSQTIEMYVVKDLAKWPQGYFPDLALSHLQAGGGVTVSATRALVDPATGRKKTHLGTKSVVYAVADRGTPLHEAVHAYCSQMFGTAGPTWFAEGIAELGHYWRDKDLSVAIEPVVLDYLQRSDPPSLEEIVDLRQQTGDSWQNYAWRWALCHLLAFNPNYSARFRPLGLDILREGPQTFQSVYGSMAPEIAFEYRLFLETLDTGSRVDLTSWDWKTKAIIPRGNSLVQSKIAAGKGWQASRLSAQTGKSYQYTADGSWTLLADGQAMTADGNADGQGRLVGVLFHDYQLSEPFELGAEGRWTAPADGALYLRCRDDWASLADNSGMITVKIRAAD